MAGQLSFMFHVYTAHPCGYCTEQDGRFFFELLFIPQTGLRCGAIYFLFFYHST